METHPGEGVATEEKCSHRRKPSHMPVCGKFQNLRGQQNREGKTHTHRQNICLTITASREVAQMLASATSKWGLGRGVWATSSVLGIRTGPECSEDNLRELMWDSNPIHGIARETKIKNKRPFHEKLYSLTMTLACSQNKGLSEYQRTESQLPYRTLPPWRQRGRHITVKGLLQSWPQTLHLPPNCYQALSC